MDTQSKYIADNNAIINSDQLRHGGGIGGHQYISYLTVNTVIDEPNLSAVEVMNRDSRNLVIQENNLYMLGVLTTSTLLIMAIFLSRSFES